MPVNEKFFAARRAERVNRLRSYLPLAEPIALPLANGRLIRVPQVHLTLRIEIELDLIANPMIAGGRATRDDAYRFLWRHHPLFLRPDCTLPNQAHRHAGLVDRTRSRLARFRMAWICGRLAWPLAAVAMQERLQVARQDSGDAAGDGGFDPAPAAPPPCAPDEFCRLFLSRGLTRDQVLDSPLAWLFQQLRSEALAGPDGEIEVIDPSDALLGTS